MDKSSTRNYVIHALDKPDFLLRLTALLRRRVWDVASLSISPSHQAGMVRVSLSLRAPASASARIEANLYKLVDIVEIQDVTETATMTRDLVIVRLKVEPRVLRHLMQACETMGARVLERVGHEMVAELSATPDEIRSFIELLKPVGILDLAHVGSVTMPRCSAPTTQARPRRSTSTYAA